MKEAELLPIEILEPIQRNKKGLFPAAPETTPLTNILLYRKNTCRIPLWMRAIEAFKLHAITDFKRNYSAASEVKPVPVPKNSPFPFLV